MEAGLLIGFVLTSFLLSGGLGEVDRADDKHLELSAVDDEHDDGDNDVSLELPSPEEFKDNWSEQPPDPRAKTGDVTIERVRRRRGRRHRDTKNGKSGSGHLKVSPQTLMKDSSRQPEGLTLDISSLYSSLMAEMESNNRLKERLDNLEVQMNIILDTNRQLSRNVSSLRSCSCPDLVRRQELDSIKIHQRRIYLMINAQEERHRDVLDLMRAYRSMIYSSADVVGELEEQIQAIQSDIRIQKVKLNKLNLDLHWSHVQEDLTSNITKQLEQELSKLQKKINGAFADHGHIYGLLDHLGISINTTEIMTGQLRADLTTYAASFMEMLKAMSADQRTGNRNGSLAQMALELLKNVSQVARTRHPERKTWTAITSDAQVNLQRQLDETSLDVEQLKDEMAHFYTFLQAVQADIRHFRGQQDEQAIQDIDVRRIKQDIAEIRKNISRLESMLDGTNDGLPRQSGGIGDKLPGPKTSSAPDSHKTTPAVRSSIRKASRLLSYVSSEEIDDFTTSMARYPEKVVIQESSPSTRHPSKDGPRIQKVPVEPLNRDYENQLDKNEHSKLQNKPKNDTFDRIKQNDVQHRTHVTRISTEPYTTEQVRITEQPDAEITDSPDLSSVTTTRMVAFPKADSSYKNSLRIKPSDSDVCSLPGIMIGHSTPIAKFADIQTGAWMRDPESRDNHIYVATGHSKIKLIREYNSTSNLVNKDPWRDFKLPIRCTGTGHVMYNGSFYCNKYKSNRIVRYNTRTNQTTSLTIKSAGYDNTYPYTIGDNTDVDFSIDEIGLWVLYSGTDHRGNIVIGKVNPETLEIYPIWETGYQKKRAVNAFMICGRLYVVSYNAAGSLELSYVYDTLRGREVPASHQPFYSVSDSVSMMSYNPKDSKLYAWVRTPQWQGQLVLYGIFFVG